MRIVHVTGYFAANMAYQENLLPVGQAELGHEVYILTGRNEPDFGFNSESRYNNPGKFSYFDVTVYRLDHYFEITNKGPILKGLMRNLRIIRPDVLFIHDVGTSFLVGILYKLLYPHVLLQVDCHSTSSNARNSKLGPLYHGFFKVMFQIFRKKFDRIFATAPETVEFMCRYYGLSERYISLLPLPGDPSLLCQAKEIRAKVRGEIDISEGVQVVVHTGKLPGDKETEAVLKAFMSESDNNRRLLIAGSVEDSYMDTLCSYMKNDSRVIYLGWLKASRLREIFLASDLLVQPGSLSNSFIDAICCGLPVLLDDTPQGRYLTSFGNGMVIQRGSTQRLAALMQSCLSTDQLNTLKLNARVASEYFGYVNNARMTLAHL